VNKQIEIGSPPAMDGDLHPWPMEVYGSPSRKWRLLPSTENIPWFVGEPRDVHRIWRTRSNESVIWFFARSGEQAQFGDLVH
jgi:hypothetical protein